METKPDIEKPEPPETEDGESSESAFEAEEKSLSAAQKAAEAAEAAAAAAQKELLYMRAEMDNYKRRMIKEQEQAIKFANEKLVREFIGVVDHFDRALHHSQNLKSRAGDAELTNFVTGIEMTHRELVQLLGRFGVEFIGTVGEPFDPARHEAISQQESATSESGTVLDVFSKGCLLQGRLIKPAQVVVAKKPG